MSRVTFEFDEQDEREDVNVIVNRVRLINALSELDSFYRALYNSKIYEPENIVYMTKDNRIATEEDFKKATEEGKPLSGKGYYIRQEWLEDRLDYMLHDVRDILEHYLY